MRAESLILLQALGLAVAQPYHGHRHAFFHQKRDVVTQYNTVYQTAPAEVVYVNPDGQVLYTDGVTSTSQVDVAAVTTTSTSVPYIPPPQPTTLVTTTQPPPAQPTVSTDGTTDTSTDDSSDASGSNQAGYGISYSPYNADGTCKSQDQVNADFEKINDFSIVRSYGVDCNQVETMLSAAKAKNMKIFLGVYNIQPASQLSADIQTLVSAVNGDWGSVHSISIGNEDVNQGRAQPADVVDATNSARTQLRSAGYQGPVVHVDTFNQIIAHPEMCEASDYAAANCHAFFDPNTAASGAGAFVLLQAQAVAAACGGKDTWITESGWPHGGDTNGLAIPSPEDQSTAIASLKSSFSSNIFLFSAFNDEWKQNNPSTFGAEQYWGFL